MSESKFCHLTVKKKHLRLIKCHFHTAEWCFWYFALGKLAPVPSRFNATLEHIRVVMDNSRTISSSRPEMVSNCLSRFMVAIATVVTVMEKLCSLLSNVVFCVLLIMDSKAAVSLYLGQGYFQRACRPTRSAAKDQGNAGKSLTKRGHGLLLLVSLLAIDVTESLRQWLCSCKAEWQPALNWVTC